MKRDSLWPEAFAASPAKDEAQPQAQAPQQQTAGTKQEASDEDEDDPFFSGGNPNRQYRGLMRRCYADTQEERPASGGLMHLRAIAVVDAARVLRTP
eukprot:m51a1_g12177 hypothetical protein (97) ;mRNA; r:178-4264